MVTGFKKWLFDWLNVSSRDETSDIILRLRTNMDTLYADNKILRERIETLEREISDLMQFAKRF